MIGSNACSELWWLTWQIVGIQSRSEVVIDLVSKEIKNRLVNQFPNHDTSPNTTCHHFKGMYFIMEPLQLGNGYKCEIYRQKTTTIYLLYIWIILQWISIIFNGKHCCSSAVPSTSYHPAEYKMIFFTHGTAPVVLITQIKIGISFENKRQFMSARWDTIHE